MHACELAPSAIKDKDKTMGDWERNREDDAATREPNSSSSIEQLSNQHIANRN
jgi:hypothetical protein